MRVLDLDMRLCVCVSSVRELSNLLSLFCVVFFDYLES